MAGPIRKTATWADKEILKFPTGLHAVKSVVLDATDFAVPDDGTRYVVPAGTILKLSSTNTTQYVEYKGGAAKVEGILGRPIDLLARVTLGNTAAPMFFHGAVFATTAIVGFTLYASALVAGMPTCKFE